MRNAWFRRLLTSSRPTRTGRCRFRPRLDTLEDRTAPSATVIATIPVGASPAGVGENAAINRTYVANNGSNTVSVINDLTNTVVATIPVGTRPNAVGVDLSTNRVYVVVANTDGTNAGVAVIDGTPASVTENQVVANVTVPGRFLGPTENIAVNPTTHRVYVPSFDPGGQVEVIDGAANTFLFGIGVAANPISAAYDPNTNSVYVGHGSFFFRNQLTIINAATNAVSNGPVVGLQSSDLGIDPTTHRLYVHKGDPSRGDPYGLVVVDTSTNTVVKTLAGGSSAFGGVGVNTVINREYVADSTANNTTIINGAPGGPATDTVVTSVNVGAQPAGVGVNPALNFIYVANTVSGTVSVIADVPDTVYVNSAFANPVVGQDPDGAGPATDFGFDSFASIQSGINAVATGGNVVVQGSSFTENVSLNRAVTVTTTAPTTVNGSLTVSAGTFQTGGQALTTGNLALSGGTLNLGGSTVGSNNFSQTGGTNLFPTTWNLAGNFSITGGGGNQSNSTLNFTGAGLQTLNFGLLGANNTVTHSGTGTLRLLAPFFGPYTINTLNVTAGAVDLNGQNVLVNALTGTATVTDGDGPATLTVNNGAPDTFGGTLSGANLALVKTGPAALTLSGGSTYLGPTTINGGTLTLTGSLTGAGAAVTLNAVNVTLNGGGVINGRGVVVAGGVTNVLISGLGGLTNSANGVGVRVPAGASARILNDTITGNNIGVLVDGGTALLQGDVLSNDTGGNQSTAAGLVAQNGAIVDAGQLPASAPYYGNITGFGTSTGGNTFLGYTPDISGNNPSVPQAIRDLNTGTAPFGPSGPELSNIYGAAGPQLGRMDLTAQNNSFGVAQLFQIEQLIFHDLDNNAFGFVTYGTTTAASPAVVGGVQYSADFSLGAVQGGTGTLFAGANLGTGQKSVIRFIQVTFSGFVFLDPGIGSPNANRGLNLMKVNGYYGAGANSLIHANVASAVYNQSNGQYTIIYSFSGPGVEFGSLEDGNYTLQFNEGAIQGGGPGGPGLSPTGDPFANQAAQFHRFFGDSNGDMQTDNTDLVAEQAANRSRRGMTNFRAYFDFNGDATVDSSDYYQFLRRYRSKLNADGSTTPLP
jgi:YVTN family beta-propeller protein/autotransporter-associated beta strand protein